MKIKTIHIGLLIILVLATSCKNWLDVLPENDQTSSEYWKTKEDVESVLAAGYVKLRSNVNSIFIWGEARGSGISFLNLIDDDAKNANKLRTLDILPTNSYSKWGGMYQVINMVNSVIKYAPSVAQNDESFNVNIMKSYLSEAYFLRALAYFYLVRTFRDVPFITEPYINDDQDYSVPQSDETTILNQLVTDLEGSLASAKEYFEEEDPFNPMNSKGRATRWASQALLADINLWMGNYDKCITACDAVISSGRVGLIARNLWFSNFYPGNSNESIFEIQYSYEKGQTNSFLSWFNTDLRYVTSSYNMQLYTENVIDARADSTGDVRGFNSTYKYNLYPLIWKYIGVDNDINNPQPRSSTNQNDQNFIIYRLADIYLMKAEAEIMKGNFSDAQELIQKIRDRAGVVSTMPTLSNESDALDVLLKERQKEFVAEGKNWFDILRIAKRDNYKYKDKLIDQVLLMFYSNSQSIIRSKLADVNSYYLPINADELKYNKLLVQNPYYDNLGK